MKLETVQGYYEENQEYLFQQSATVGFEGAMAVYDTDVKGLCNAQLFTWSKKLNIFVK